VTSTCDTYIQSIYQQNSEKRNYTQKKKNENALR